MEKERQVSTARGIRICLPIQVRTPPNRINFVEQTKHVTVLVHTSVWFNDSTLNVFFLISKMRKGNKKAKKVL